MVTTSQSIVSKKKGEKNLVNQAADEFDDLLARIRDPRTRVAGDTLFGHQEAFDLATTFKPGQTETL